MRPTLVPITSPISSRISSPITRRQACAVLSALAASLGSSMNASAQSEHALRIILPVAAGSGVDTIMRAASSALGHAMGQALVIDNQPGAGGVVGTAALVKAAPDGNTIAVVSNNHVIYPSIMKGLPFDPLADITPIAVLGGSSFVLVVNPKLPAHNARELVALFKASPGKYNYASSGNGTILHLAAEMFKEQTGTYVTHIPYRGVGPMLQDILAGQVDIGVLALPSIQAHLKSGSLRAIGLASAERNPAAPDIPTFAEQGYPKYLVEGWFAAIGPKGLSTAHVAQVHAAFVSAFAAPDLVQAMARQGNTIHIGTPQAAETFFKTELQKYAALVKKSGLQLQ